MEPEPNKQETEKKQELTPAQKLQMNQNLNKLLQMGGIDQQKLKEMRELYKPHKFWDTQPMLRDDKQNIQFGAVSEINKIQQVQKQPYKLPQGFSWCEIDLNNQIQLTEFYILLTQNYVEDDDNNFRFDYSREFLKWALTPPGYQKTWIVGVRMDGKLVASITGVPVHCHVQKQKIKMAEINFLCVHKKIRQKRLAPVLIKEVTRRVNLRDKWQAIYTAGKTLPTPFTQARYWHRSLNPKKLIDVRFSGLGKNQTVARLQKLYKLPEQTTLPGLRPMNKKDIASVFKIVNAGLQKYVVKFRYTEQEIKHYFLPIPNVIYSYVIEKDKKVTDFLSFYNLPSHVMKHEKHKFLRACYSYYNFANTVPLKDLIENALILAKNEDFDVYNCLDIMQNKCFFEDLKFMVGDGHLNYYLYNWVLSSKKIKPEQLGVVLV